jgi:hypothetical protein
MAEDLTRTIGEPFPQLPPALVEGGPERFARWAARFVSGKVLAKSTADYGHSPAIARQFSGEGGMRKRHFRSRRAANVSEGRRRGKQVEPPEDSSQPPQPKAAGSDAATVAAIKAALDEGRFERAAALLDVLRRTDGAGQVIALEGRRDRRTP